MNYNSTNNYSNIIWYTTISTKIQINEFQKSIEHKRKHSSKSTQYNFLTKWKKKSKINLNFIFMLILKVPDSYYFCHTCFKLLVMLWYLNFFSEIASSVVPARGRGFDVVPPLRSSNSAKPARILGSWERKSRNEPKRHKSNGAGRSWSARGGDSGSAIPSGQLYNSQTRREPPSRNH